MRSHKVLAVCILEVKRRRRAGEAGEAKYSSRSATQALSWAEEHLGPMADSQE